MLMRLLKSVVLLAVLGSVGLAQQPAPPKTHLKVGDAAPNFKLRATDGQTYQLSDFRARRTSCSRSMCWLHRWLNEMKAYQADSRQIQSTDTQVLA